MHRRQRQYCLAISLRLTFEIDLIGAKGGHERRVDRISDREMTEKELAFAFAKSLTAIAPNRHHPVDLGLHLRRDAPVRKARTSIHRQMCAQGLKSRVQLRTHGTGNR